MLLFLGLEGTKFLKLERAVNFFSISFSLFLQKKDLFFFGQKLRPDIAFYVFQEQRFGIFSETLISFSGISKELGDSVCIIDKNMIWIY